MEMLDFEFLGKADEVTLKLEKAKKSLETAKLDLENAKNAYEELFAQCDKHGFNKAKLKKLTEDRVNALLEVMSADSKSEKAKKPKKIKETTLKNTEEMSTDLEVIETEDLSLSDSIEENQIFS